LVEHRIVTLGSALAEPTGIKRTSVWRDFALAKSVALKEHEEHGGRTVYTVEF
jgi:hypothetical protein